MNVLNEMVPVQISEKLFCLLSSTLNIFIYFCPMFSTFQQFWGMI